MLLILGEQCTVNGSGQWGSMRFKGATRQFVPFFRSFASLSRRINFLLRFCRSCGQFTTWTRPGQRESTTVLTNGSPPRNPRWSHGWLSRGLRWLIRQYLNPVTKLLLSTLRRVDHTLAIDSYSDRWVSLLESKELQASVQNCKNNFTLHWLMKLRRENSPFT